MTQHGGGRAGPERGRIRDTVEPVVLAAGYDLEDVAVSRAGHRSLVKVTVDADGGVTLDAVAALSREISSALDDSERTGGAAFGGRPYTLEVSSPGVDRPLTAPRHWRRNVGRLVRVRAGERTLLGRVAGADDTAVRFALVAGPRNAATGETATFDHAQLGTGKVQVEFGKVDNDESDAAVGAAPTGGKEEA